MNSFIMWLLCALVLLALNLCAAKKPVPGHLLRHHQHQLQCFSPEELKDKPANWLQQFVGSHVRWEKYNAVNMVEHLEDMQGQKKRHRRHQQHSCPHMSPGIPRPEDLNRRSISPWTYRIDVDENRYPEKLAFAECLCSGCIDLFSGVETTNGNSVAIEQTMMVLRRKQCHRSPGMFTFEVEYIKVPVGCTCVIPKH